MVIQGNQHLSIYIIFLLSEINMHTTNEVNKTLLLLLYVCCKVCSTSLLAGIVFGPHVGASRKDPNKKDGVISKPALYGIVAIGSALIIVLLIVVIILYRRRKLYGGFYIFTLPPMPDYIRKLDPDKSLIEQTHKLPYDAEWEFPRERLELGEFSLHSRSCNNHNHNC